MYAQIDTIGHMGLELPAFGSADYSISSLNIMKHLIVANKSYSSEHGSRYGHGRHGGVVGIPRQSVLTTQHNISHYMLL